MIQDTVAFVAFGKNKGKGKGTGRYPVRPSSLSSVDRRLKLRELKAKTECKDCGRKGHWRGDPQCTARRAHLVIKDLDVAGPQHTVPRFCASYSCPRDSRSDQDTTPTTFVISEFAQPLDDKFPYMHAITRPEPVSSRTTSTPTRPREDLRSEATSMEWTFPDGLPEPPGSDQCFSIQYKQRST